MGERVEQDGVEPAGFPSMQVLGCLWSSYPAAAQATMLISDISLPLGGATLDWSPAHLGKPSP